MPSSDQRNTKPDATTPFLYWKTLHPPVEQGSKTCRMSSDLTGRHHHPQNQGKIEHYHRSIKNVIKLDTTYFPEQLKEHVGALIDHNNNYRYNESLDNMILVDIYMVKSKEINGEITLEK